MLWGGALAWAVVDLEAEEGVVPRFPAPASAARAPAARALLPPLKEDRTRSVGVQGGAGLAAGPEGASAADIRAFPFREEVEAPVGSTNGAMVFLPLAAWVAKKATGD